MRISNEVGRWYSIPCKILTQVIYVKKNLNPLKRIRVIIRTPTHGRTDGRTDRQTDGQTGGRTGWIQYTPPQLRCGGYNNGLGPIRQQVIIWANDCLAYWCIYASLGINELKLYRKWFHDNNFSDIKSAMIADSLPEKLSIYEHFPFMTHKSCLYWYKWWYVSFEKYLRHYNFFL